MTEFPAAFNELVAALRQLPSVGARSAERLALFLIDEKPLISERLARALLQAKETIQPCPDCGFYSEAGLCAICRDPTRDPLIWCLVEKPSEVLKFEKSGTYRGLYHVLGGVLSPLDGIGPEDLNIAGLFTRIERQRPREIILALSTNVEGDTTSLYLAPQLHALGLSVTRLATGLPAGGGLEYADSVTLGYALAGRKEMA
jgi:recombination protein RecR